MSKINLELDVDLKTLRFMLYESYCDLNEILEYDDTTVIAKAQKKIENLLVKKYNKATEDIFLKADRETIDRFIEFLQKEKEEEEEQPEQLTLPL